MKSKLFSILFLIFGLFSCNDDELSPEARVQGTYEFLYEVDQSGGEALQDFARTIELRADGTFYKENITRNISSGDVLGYRGYSSGTYTIEDGIVELLHEEIYSRNQADLKYVPKEELPKSDLDGYSELYSILKDNSELESICPFNADCLAPQVYTRID